MICQAVNSATERLSVALHAGRLQSPLSAIPNCPLNDREETEGNPRRVCGALGERSREKKNDVGASTGCDEWEGLSFHPRLTHIE